VLLTVLAGIGAFVLTGCSRAASFPSALPVQQAPGYYRATLGEFEVIGLSDGNTALHLDQLLSHPDVVKAEYAAAHEAQPVNLSINAYVVKTKTHVVLIDTGAGDLLGPGSGKLLVNLKAAGLSPERIDTILITHIHVDHSGGLAIKGVPQFPNASVYVDRRDVDWFVTREDTSDDSPNLQTIVRQARATVGPYISQKKVKYLEADGAVVPGITSRRQSGHTPGHTAYLVESEGHRMLVWGDIIHATEVQFAHPEITIQYDVDRQRAAEQRLRECQFAVDDGLVVGSAHISFPGLGHVRRIGAGYQWYPIPYSSSVNELDPK